jgi:hypothetical protein
LRMSSRRDGCMQSQYARAYYIVKRVRKEQIDKLPKAKPKR